MSMFAVLELSCCRRERVGEAVQLVFGRCGMAEHPAPSYFDISREETDPADVRAAADTWTDCPGDWMQTLSPEARSCERIR